MLRSPITVTSCSFFDSASGAIARETDDTSEYLIGNTFEGISGASVVVL